MFWNNRKAQNEANAKIEAARLAAEQERADKERIAGIINARREAMNGGNGAAIRDGLNHTTQRSRQHGENR